MSSTSRTPWAGLACAIAGSIAFSGKAIIVKLAYRHGVDAITVILLRMAMALPFFALLAWWAGRGQPALTRRDLLVVAGLGFCGYYLASMLDFMGLAYISAGLERLILYLNPTLVLLLGWLRFGRRASRRQLVAMALSYAGVLLAFSREANLEGDHVLLGGALVFASAVSYAVYLVYSGEEVKRLGSMRLTGLASSVACWLCIAQYLLLRPLSDLAAVPVPVFWLSLLNALACTVAPVLLVMLAIERLGAGLTAQTGMIGPLSTITLGVLVLGEPFSGWIAAGTLLVLAGVALLAHGQRAGGG
jgi:drug/metabolite transporter (DMT)-like permease